MCKLFEKECRFDFDDACLRALGELKAKLVSAPITISPYWGKPFEVICDANGVALVWYWYRKEKRFSILFTMPPKLCGSKELCGD